MEQDDVRVGERMATVETDLKFIKEYMVRLEGKLDAWNDNYVPRNEISEMFRSRDKEIQELKDTRNSNKTMWAAWAAVAVAAIAILVSIWPNK